MRRSQSTRASARLVLDDVPPVEGGDLHGNGQLDNRE